MQKMNNVNNLNTFFNDFNNHKKFLLSLNNLIKSFIFFGNTQFNSQFDEINANLPNKMKELGLPFCDLMSHYDTILNYYVRLYISKKEDVIKNILITLINVFNFKANNKNPADLLIEELQIYDNEIGKMAFEKRAEKNEIEEMYDNMNLPDLNEEHIKQLKEKINEMEKKNVYPIYTIQYFKEKVLLMESNLQKKQINNLICNINNIKYNLINNTNFNYFLNNIQLNNNINIINNGLTDEEMKKLKETPIKDREYLYKEEDLNDEEDEYTEFKNYFYPFSQKKIYELKRQYCGFLNNHGGRIYIGIDDLRIVKGLRLNKEERDAIKKELLNYTCDFYPECRAYMSVNFIPIKNMQTKRAINNLYVIKINVMPGDSYHLYSLTSKDGFISTLRLPGQCINLTAEEIYTEIMKRGELLQRSYTNEQNDNESDNEENINNDPDESIFESEYENTGEETDNGKNKKKIIYVVKISNIDTSLEIKKVNNHFNGSGRCDQKFYSENGKSTGFGELIFSKKEMAKRVIKKFNGTKICGEKKIIMKLRKRVKPA